MRQRNTWPWTVDVPEFRDADGTVYPPAEVAGGDVIDRPVPLVGFAAAAGEPAAKPTKKAAAPAAPETEV